MVFAYNISLCEYGKRTLPKKFALLVPFSHASCLFSGLSVFIVFASDQSVTRTDWSRPEVSIHGAGQMIAASGDENVQIMNSIKLACSQPITMKKFSQSYHKWTNSTRQIIIFSTLPFCNKVHVFIETF